MLGPLTDHSFVCVRGRDCNDLQPVHGTGLSGSLVSLRSAGCGSAKGQRVSPANQDGIANVTEATNLSGVTTNHSGVPYYVLTFGTSNLQEGIDYRLSVNADDAGHYLCWCGLESCSEDSFVVPLGRLRVEGPLANQEARCSVGQPCPLNAIQSVGLNPDDRLGERVPSQFSHCNCNGEVNITAPNIEVLKKS